CEDIGAKPGIERAKRLIWNAFEIGFGAAPIVVAVMAFNAARFGSPWESGYSRYYEGWRPLFSFDHMSLHLRMMAFSPYLLLPRKGGGIDLHPGGTSLVLASPFLFAAIFGARLSWLWLGACLSIGLMLLSMLAYRSFGYLQYNSFRYTLDFVPI